MKRQHLKTTCRLAGPSENKASSMGVVAMLSTEGSAHRVAAQASGCPCLALTAGCKGRQHGPFRATFGRC